MAPQVKDIMLDATKIQWHQDRLRAWLRGERVAPITIDIALTQSCNYKCGFCYAQVQYNEPRHMSRDVFFRFLDDCAEIGVRGISLVGDGESTLVPYYADAIVHGRENGIDMATGTNGSMLTREILERVLSRQVYFRVNIPAATPERYLEITGTTKENYDRVLENIRTAVEIKRRDGLEVTIGMQMVFRPREADELVPLAKLGRDLGVDYLVIKHCADDIEGTIGVEYDHYSKVFDRIREAESYSTDTYLVKAKWNKIKAGHTKVYSRCYGAPFILDLSGSGLVAPCAIFFNKRYKRYHIGNVIDTPFKELWEGERYWEVMDLLASEEFDPRTMCTFQCLAELPNVYLWKLKTGELELREPQGSPPPHVNFI